MNKSIKFILAIAVQLLIVFSIIIFKLSVLSGGTKVLLIIEPVDPRDLLRGDYVTFQYNISNPGIYYMEEEIRNGDTVYVVLRRSGEYWLSQEVRTSQPTDGSLFIKGKVAGGGIENQDELSIDKKYNAQNIHIDYGIEEYFIPEGEGRNFSFWDKEAMAEVVVDDNGNAVLKQIYVDGSPWP